MFLNQFRRGLESEVIAPYFLLLLEKLRDPSWGGIIAEETIESLQQILRPKVPSGTDLFLGGWAWKRLTLTIYRSNDKLSDRYHFIQQGIVPNSLVPSIYRQRG